MKKYTVLVVLFSLCIFQSAFGEAKLKVAVLDATIGNGVEENASAIVADTINEQFVKSGRYIAIDRAYISKIQAEKKFQLSGEVNSDDVKELGALFGAQYICVANVSKLGSTYTVSARMIDVTTAQVINQESAKQRGEIDVLFDVAETVGTKLVGKNHTTSADSQQKSKTEKKKAPVQSVKKHKTRSRITVGYMLTGFNGDDNSIKLYDLSPSDIDYLFGLLSGETITVSHSNAGINMEYLFPFGNFYVSSGFTYTKQTLSSTFYDFVSKSGDNFFTMDISLGLGGIYALGSSFQVFGGLTLGYMYYEFGDFWNDQGDSADGMSFGFETGVDFFLGSFCLNLTYKFAQAPDIFSKWANNNNNFDTSFGTSGLILGAGYSW